MGVAHGPLRRRHSGNGRAVPERTPVDPIRSFVSLRRSLACTNSLENMVGARRRVCRNVQRWRNAAMALRWPAAGMMEAAKGFRRLKAYKHLPLLRVALAAHQSKYVTQRVEHDANAA